MAIPLDAFVNPQKVDLERMKEGLLSQLVFAKNYWKPLHSRQDYWMNMYLLLDVVQQSKPLGVARRFVSNDPRTGFDAALAILTRNPIPWRIPLTTAEDENADQRRLIGQIERTLTGLNYDLDELFTMRGLPTLWKQIFFQALIRGWVWGKFHITTEALKYRRSPLVAEIYDARMVYPHFDQWGLNHIFIEKKTNLGDLVSTYPLQFGNRASQNNFDPHTPAVKIEFWSNDRDVRKGIHAVLAQVGTPAQAGTYTVTAVGRSVSEDAEWVIPPFFHGYTYDNLPVVGAPVNGINIQAKPALSSPLEQRLTERADLLAMEAWSWHGANSQVAESGRSILSSVEEQVPQYNELIATIFQHLSIGTYGTWVFKTPTGEMPEFHPGIESRIALNPGESVERIAPEPISPDAYRLVELLQQEREKGVLSNILQSVTPFSGTGVLFEQMTNSALNSIEPYHNGGVQFGTLMGSSIMGQLQVAGREIGSFQLDAPTPKQTYFRVEFDPAMLDKTRHYRAIPVLKPALPDDLTVRMTAARMALDPRAPMLSLLTVMETILQIDDPMGEMDRIFEDMAQRDPVLLPEIMAQAFDRLNEPAMAARMRETEFEAQLIADLQLRQLTGNLGTGGAGGQQGPEGGTVFPAPAAGGSASTRRDGSSQSLPRGAEAAGAAGQRVSV